MHTTTSAESSSLPGFLTAGRSRMSRLARSLTETPLFDHRRLALVAIYGFGFFAPWSIAGGRLFQLVLFVVLIRCVLLAGDRARREPLLLLAGIFYLYMIVRGGVAVLERPDLIAAHWDGAFHWIKGGPLSVLAVAAGFVAVGNWRHHVPRVLGLWIIGIFVNAVRKSTPQQILDGLQSGVRVDFGIHYYEAGVTLMAAILIVAAFAPSLTLMIRSRRFTWGAVAATLLLIGLLVTGCVATGTRTAWVGGAVGLIAMAALAARNWKRRHEGSMRRPAAVLGVSLALILVLGAVFSDRIVQRMSPALDTMAAVPFALLEGDLSNIDDGSIGERAALWLVAARAFADRPWFGRGPADVRYVLLEYPLPPQLEYGYTPYLHSGYSLVLNRFGIVGAIPIVLFFLCMFRAAGRLMRDSDGIAVSLGMLAAGFTVSMLTIAIADQRFTDYHIVHVYSLIVGAALAPGLENRLFGGDGSSQGR